MSDNLKAMFAAVVEGDPQAVEREVRLALGSSTPPDEILSIGLVAAMKEVGARFECGDLYVPEMMVAARAMKAGLAILKPHLSRDATVGRGKVIVGTVKGDLHDIGKNLVAMMLEGAGCEVIDLGTDVPPEKFAATARETGAGIIGLSALLTTTMQNMRSTVEALEDLGIRRQVRVIVGGAPVTEAFSKDIGADGYAPDAALAVKLVQRLTGS